MTNVVCHTKMASVERGLGKPVLQDEIQDLVLDPSLAALGPLEGHSTTISQNPFRYMSKLAEELRRLTSLFQLLGTLAPILPDGHRLPGAPNSARDRGPQICARQGVDLLTQLLYRIVVH